MKIIFQLSVLALISTTAFADSPWPRHTIDQSSQGADGARLADINGDGLLDVVTPWEEGGAIRVAFHPGYDRVKERWPSVEVGRVGNPEDAVAIDLDGNGQLDVLSSCEGNTRSLYVHWAPKDPTDLMKPEAWETEEIPASRGMMQFMFSVGLDVNRDGRIDIVTGGKGKDAEIGWFEAPQNPRVLKDWIWHEIAEVGWIMSIRPEPRGRDNTPALLMSDRRGAGRGVYRLFPTGGPAGSWEKRLIGGDKNEVLFLDYVRTPPNRWMYAWGTRYNGSYLKLTKSSTPIHFPITLEIGHGKGVAFGDLNGDGLDDLAITSEHSKGLQSVFFYAQPARGADLAANWIRHDIGGITGTKFDRIELVDLDHDGDLDLLTCEEAENLGVIWYENPN